MAPRRDRVPEDLRPLVPSEQAVLLDILAAARDAAEADLSVPAALLGQTTSVRRSAATIA